MSNSVVNVYCTGGLAAHCAEPTERDLPPGAAERVTEEVTGGADRVKKEDHSDQVRILRCDKLCYQQNKN